MASLLETTKLSQDTQSINKKTLVIMDTGLEGYPVVIDSISAEAEVYLLSSEQNAISQLTHIFSKYTDVQNVHIVSHGSPDTIHFSSGSLNLANLHVYAEQIKTWRTSLSNDANILLHGDTVTADSPRCDTQNNALLRRIAELTQANIYS